MTTILTLQTTKHQPGNNCVVQDLIGIISFAWKVQIKINSNWKSSYGASKVNANEVPEEV